MSVINVRFMEHRGAGGGDWKKWKKCKKSKKCKKCKKWKQKSRVFGEAGTDVEFWWECLENIRDEKMASIRRTCSHNFWKCEVLLLLSLLSYQSDSRIWSCLMGVRKITAAMLCRGTSIELASLYLLSICWFLSTVFWPEWHYGNFSGEFTLTSVEILYSSHCLSHSFSTVGLHL